MSATGEPVTGERVTGERVTARSGMPAWRWVSPQERGGVVFLAPSSSWGGGAEPPRNAPPSGGELRSVGGAHPVDLFVAAGFTVVVPDLGWRARALERTDRGVAGVAGVEPGARHLEGEPAEDDPGAPADPDAIAGIGEARELLPAGPRFVVGVGSGGLFARLAACAVLGLDGAVAFGGRVRYPGVSARRPIQPLDLLPGLGAALQCHFDDDDPDALPAHVDELERRLAGVTRPWQVFRYSAGSPGLAGWRGAAAPTAWARARSFLLHLAAERR